ncbi:MAG: hypothetical protein RJQ00_05245 [Vicingaceae bacterium]
MEKIKLSELNLGIDQKVDLEKYYVLVEKDSLDTKVSLFYLIDKNEFKKGITGQLKSADVKDGYIKPIILIDSNNEEFIPPAAIYIKKFHEDKYFLVDIEN